MPAFATTRPLRRSDEWTLIPSTFGIALSNASKTVRLSNGYSASPELLADPRRQGFARLLLPLISPWLLQFCYR